MGRSMPSAHDWSVDGSVDGSVDALTGLPLLALPLPWPTPGLASDTLALTPASSQFFHAVFH